MFYRNWRIFLIQVEVKGVVLLTLSFSREVVPAFARILLRTSLGKKHLVRPLLRAEITQVVNRRAWYDATKLTTEVLSIYKVCLHILQTILCLFQLISCHLVKSLILSISKKREKNLLSCLRMQCMHLKFFFMHLQIYSNHCYI